MEIYRYTTPIPYEKDGKIYNFQNEIALFKTILIKEYVFGKMMNKYETKFDKTVDFNFKEIKRNKEREALYKKLFFRTTNSLQTIDKKELIHNCCDIIKNVGEDLILIFEDFDLAKLMKIKSLQCFEEKFSFLKNKLKKYENFEDEIIYKLI